MVTLKMSTLVLSDAVRFCMGAGVDLFPELIQAATRHVQADDDALLQRTLWFKQSNGRWGFAEHAPFDCIHVGAAGGEIPADLIRQLKPGGRLVMPVRINFMDDVIIVHTPYSFCTLRAQIGDDKDLQVLHVVDKDPSGRVIDQPVAAVRFVPLLPGHPASPLVQRVPHASPNGCRVSPRACNASVTASPRYKACAVDTEYGNGEQRVHKSPLGRLCARLSSGEDQGHTSSHSPRVIGSATDTSTHTQSHWMVQGPVTRRRRLEGDQAEGVRSALSSASLIADEAELPAGATLTLNEESRPVPLSAAHRQSLSSFELARAELMSVEPPSLRSLTFLCCGFHGPNGVGYVLPELLVSRAQEGRSKSTRS